MLGGDTSKQPSEAAYDHVTYDELRRQVAALRFEVRKLRLRQSVLERSMRAKDEFLAMLGHELRKPLGAISAAVALQCALATDDHRLAKARDVITRQAAHMSRIVDDIYDLSRIMRGRVQLRADLHDLGALVSENVNDFRAVVARRHHELHLDVPTQPIWVRADATRIAQILANLLDNAMKFTVPPGHIRVCVRMEEDLSGRAHAVIAVNDTGIGMDQSSAEGIFGNGDADHFRGLGVPMPTLRASRTGAHAGTSHGASDTGHSRPKHIGPRVVGDAIANEGLGVGLALVKALVQLHEGSVDAFSDGPGFGSEFIVRLPLAATSTTTKMAPASHADCNFPG